MNSLDEIKSDAYRQYAHFSWPLTIKGALARRTFRVVLTMRLCQAAANSHGVLRVALPFFKILHRIATHLAGVDFSWKTSVGAGLAVTDAWGLEVSRGARIGCNATLYHAVTLGRRDRISPDGERHTGYPVLEDEVWIGPHAIIVGGVTIGRGSRIAGGAFVTDSVPPYSIVAGNPATIVKTNCVPDIMNRAPL